MDKVLLVLGAGGHAKVVADCALTSGNWQSVAFLDDRYPALKQVGHWPVVGRVSDFEEYISQYPFMALGVGNNNLRLEWLKRGREAGVLFPEIVHPSAVISSFASVGTGSVVFAGVVVNIDAAIGSACILNTKCSVDHDCVIGDGTHISPGAALAGGVCTGENVWIGMNASVIQCSNIGAEAIIGAGAVVLNDVPGNTTVAGVPAKAILTKNISSDNFSSNKASNISA